MIETNISNTNDFKESIKNKNIDLYYRNCCPVCGSADIIETDSETIKITNYKCNTCLSEGDFFNENDTKIESAVLNLNKLVCTKESKCNGWQKSMKQIEGSQSLALAHGISYTGYMFIFCPWCGRKIQ